MFGCLGTQCVLRALSVSPLRERAELCRGPEEGASRQASEGGAVPLGRAESKQFWLQKWAAVPAKI